MSTEALEDPIVEDAPETPVVEAPAVEVEPPAPETDGDTVVQGPWGDDWREKAAGEDEKALTRLSRYKSPQDFVKAHMALQQKMSSGEMVATLPDNASEKEVAEYRKANGIPEAPDGYLDALPDGLVVGDEDKPIVAEYLKEMHAANARPEHVNKALGWYYREIEERKAALVEEDRRFSQAAEDELRSEWGGEYRPNVNVLNSFMDTLPGDLRAEFEGARTTSGAPLNDHPEFKRWMLNVASELNPAGTVIPAGGESAVGSLEGRRTELESMMRSDRAKYEKHHKQEYGEILAKLERLGKL